MRIYGASDDLVEIEGVDGGDEIGCYEQDVVVTVEEPGGPGAVRVTMSYVAGGVWAATISQIDEDAPIPWPVIVTSRRYSTVVDIACPSDVPWRFDRFKARRP